MQVRKEIVKKMIYVTVQLEKEAISTTNWRSYLPDRRISCTQLSSAPAMVCFKSNIVPTQVEKIRAKLTNLNHCAVPFKPRRRQLVLVLP